MTPKRQLGIYFGSKTLSIVETNNQTPEKFVSASHGMFNKPDETQISPVPDEITLTAIVQKTLREQKIAETDVKLSLPTKDIIFRSFVIPAMQASEIRGVVEFEARKYMPFKLEEVTYTYQPVSFTDDKVRKIRILFTAIKKEILDRYTQVLEESGLNITFIEPAAVSLVRALTLRNQIPSDQSIAVIEATEKEGRIIIVNNGIPHFVREFRLVPSATETVQIDPEVLSIRLFNEIRNSLGYYTRQHGKHKIDGIITLAADESPGALDNLGKELSIATVSLSANSILGTSSLVETDVLYAFGAGLKEAVPLPANFDLLPKSTKPFRFSKENINTKTLSKTAIGCAIVLALTFFFSGRISIQHSKRISTLNAQQEPYGNLTVEEIRQKNQDALAKLKEYKAVPQTTNVAKFLDLIPKLLPQEAWLTELDIENLNETVSANGALADKTVELPPGLSQAQIEMTGYVFHENAGLQIKLINTFVSDLKNEREVASYFESVDLLSAQTQSIDGYLVTSFRIVCR